MASIEAWRPPPGRFNVNVGPALMAALETLDDGLGHPAPPTEHYAFRYHFKPESLDVTRPGKIDQINQKNSTLLLDQPSTSGEAEESRHTFNGVQTSAKDFECVLILDDENGVYTLDKLECWLDLKYDRAASKSVNGRAQSPLDESPVGSGMTAWSNSPPTPPQPNFQGSQNGQDISAALDLDLDLGVPVPAPPARPKPRPKPRAIAAATPEVKQPGPSQVAGKRLRDPAVQQKPRPTKRLPSPKPLSLPSKPPTPPRRQRSPDQFGPIPGSTFSFDTDEDEAPVAPAPPTKLSSGFTLTIEESPEIPPAPIRQPFSEDLVEGASDEGMDTMFDDLGDEDGDGEGDAEMEIDGEVDADVGSGLIEEGFDDDDDDNDDDDDDEDEDDDPFGQELEEAFNQSVPSGNAPISMNDFVGDDEESEEESDEDSD